MVYKEVSRVDILEVVGRWQAGMGTRAIARGTGIARATVGRYLKAAERCGIQRDGPPPTEEQMAALASVGRAGRRWEAVPTERILEPWAGRIEEWLKRDRLRLTRIQELLRERGCVVPYRSLHRFAARRGWKRQRRGGSTVRMAETPPGEVAEFDFGRLGYVRDAESGRRRLAWALVLVLAYSRHMFLWPLHRQQLADVIEGLEAAWAFFRGIPRYLVFDNFPAAVAGADPLHPRLTRGFMEYARHRGFIGDPGRARHPRDKPKSEKSVDFSRERFFKGGSFRDLADMRAQARQWCLTVAGQRVHGTTRRLPLVVFQQEEQEALLPYDGEPYEIPLWTDAQVHSDHHVAFQKALYSAPHHLAPPGSKLEVRGDTSLVRLYHRGRVIKVHPRKPPGGRSTDPNDYPQALTPYTTRAPDQVRESAARLGAGVGSFAEELLGGPVPWSRLRQGHKLLRLGERYGAERLDAACRRALEVELIDVRRVERILVEALEGEPEPNQGAAAAPPGGRFVRPGSSFAWRGDGAGSPSGEGEAAMLHGGRKA